MVSEHGPPVILDELCVLVMHGFQLHVFPDYALLS